MVNINKLRKMEKEKGRQKSTPPSKQDSATAPLVPPQKSEPPAPSPEPKAAPATTKPSPKELLAEQPRPSAEIAKSPKVPKQAEQPSSRKGSESTAQPTGQVNWAEKLASDETKELITFRLDGRLFGIFVDNVHSVVKPMHITRVAHVEAYMTGIMNLRGIITPIYDLKQRFGIGRSAITEKTRILILQLTDNLVGFVVDEIATLHNIRLSTIQAAPEISLGVSRNYIKGVVAVEGQDELILILALEEIVNSKGKDKTS